MDVTENRISPQAALATAVKVLNANISLASEQQLKLKQLQQAIALNPHTDELLVQRARLYLELIKANHNKQKQKYLLQLALADYDCAIKITAAKADYFMERAEVNCSLRQFEQAIADCLQAKGLSPSNASYQTKLLKFKCLQQKLAAAKRLKRIRYGVEIMIVSFLFALVGTFLWGSGAFIYAIPFITAALAIFFIGFIEVLANETKMYQTRKNHHGNIAPK